MNEPAAIKAIRCSHHALISALHDDHLATLNCLRLALAQLFELVDEETRLDLVREYQADLGKPTFTLVR